MSKSRTKEWEELQEIVKEGNKTNTIGVGIFSATLIIDMKKDYSDVIFNE